MKISDWEKLKQNFQLIDVREAFEFKNEHLANSFNLPLGNVTAQKVQKLCGEQIPLFICQSGARSAKALDKVSADLPEAQSLEGGLNQCKAEGIQLEGEGKGIALERQVRIAAGTLVLTGIVLMKAGFSGAEYLSAFVGAGLIFAGITNTCGMAILLAKMPWNSK